MKINNFTQILKTKLPTADKKANSMIAKMSNQIVSNDWDSIPYDLKVSFAKLYKKRGKTFVRQAYKELVKNQNLSGFVPRNIRFKNLGVDTSSIHIGSTNKIYFSKSYAKAGMNSEKIGTIAHELTHCRQYCDYIQSSHYGVDSLADIIVSSSFEKYLSNFEENKVIADTMNKSKTKLVKDLKKYYSKSFKNPKTNESILELNRLEKYKSALSNYKEAADSQVEYLGNYLEQEAYSQGDAMKKYFEIFMSYFNKA